MKLWAVVTFGALSAAALAGAGCLRAPDIKQRVQPAVGGDEKTVSGKGAARTVGERREEWSQYESPEWRYRISYPKGWMAAVVFENSGSPPEVIKQETNFLSTDGVTFVLDVWENPQRTGLVRWFNDHQKFPLNQEKAISEADLIQLAGFPAVKVSQPQTEQAYGEVIYVVGADNLIFRFRYIDSDEGKSSSLFERMALSITLNP